MDLPPSALGDLAERMGGDVRPERRAVIVRMLAPSSTGGAHALVPLLSRRYVQDARNAIERGAAVLADPNAIDGTGIVADWVHPHAGWALACLLDDAIAKDALPIVGAGAVIAESAVLGPRVTIGARVVVGPGAVIGNPGFGFVTGPNGHARAVPQKGGVVIEDDVAIGALTTVDAGTLAPTIIRRGAKLDAHVHVGHNGDVGEGAILCAQTGLAGSVVIGRGAVLGGQVGVADHCTIGAGAKIAAKSGVIGDVPPGAVFAGYPAIERGRWLRGLARVFARPRP